MDPVSLITTAIVTGAALGLAETASQAVKDTYSGLKALIVRKFGSDSTPSKVIEAIEMDPDLERLRKRLAEALADVNAGELDELREVAQQLLDQAQEQSDHTAKYVTQIMGNVQGLVQANHAHVTMTFGQSTETGDTKAKP